MIGILIVGVHVRIRSGADLIGLNRGLATTDTDIR
jgi:hypothetical protein